MVFYSGLQFTAVIEWCGVSAPIHETKSRIPGDTIICISIGGQQDISLFFLSHML